MRKLLRNDKVDKIIECARNYDSGLYNLSQARGRIKEIVGLIPEEKSNE